MTIGSKIQVNNGEIETLIKKGDGYGLFSCTKYKVVRQLNRIIPDQILFIEKELTQQKLF